MPHTFHLIPHTHWDREWYLTRAGFHARLVPVLDDLLDLLERDPAYRAFLLDGQTVHVEDYLRARPDAAERVGALVRAGRLQVGPWYVLADEQVPSGEAMVRNLLLGARDARRLGGRLEALYSPDAFGHPSVWPVLAAEFGIGAGALWRGVGGEPGQTHDLYRWRGPGGADVLVYHLPPDGYEVGAGLPTDPGRLALAWPALRETLVARAATGHVAVLVGADHHAAHPGVVALRDALARIESARDGSEVRVSRLDEFLAAAGAALAAEGRDAPTLEGELRWSYGYTWTLQGVHATRAHQKRRNSAVELLLERGAEPLAALEALAGGRDRRPLLELAWRAVVRSQFHDTLGGCCADAVADAAAVRWSEAEAYGEETARAALYELLGHDADAVREGEGERALLALWNPAARPRGGVATADLTCFRRDVPVGPPSGRTPRAGDGCGAWGERPALLAPDGTMIPVQVLHRDVTLERRDAPRHYPDLDEVERVRVAFVAPEVRGLGLLRLRAAGASDATAAPPAGSVRVAGATIGNDIVEVTVERDATLTLLDRRSGERWSGLLAPESAADVGDTYTWCPLPGDRAVTRVARPSIRTLAAGPLVGAIEGRWSLGPGLVELRLVVQLAHGSALVRCTLELVNRRTDHRLRLRLPVGVRGAAVAGVQLGALRRAPVVVEPNRYPRETPVATAPAHRWVGAASGRRGLALLAPGFFEYEWTPGGDLWFTVLRAVGELSKPDLATRPGNAGWATATPRAQCLGPDRLQLALLPVPAGELDDAARMSAAWEDAFLPLRTLWLRETTAASAADTPWVELEGEGLVHSACKPAEDGEGMVLRCWNAAGEPREAVWRFGTPVGEARRVRADETETERLQLEDGGRTVWVTVAGHGLASVRIGPRRSGEE